mgnify:FL=1
MATLADLANYNTIPGAPTTAYGTPYSAVGGNEYLNIPQFISSFVTPAYNTGYTPLLPSNPQPGYPQYVNYTGSNTFTMPQISYVPAVPPGTIQTPAPIIVPGGPVGS